MVAEPPLNPSMVDKDGTNHRTDVKRRYDADTKNARSCVSIASLWHRIYKFSELLCPVAVLRPFV